MDLCGLPVGGDELADALCLQTTHGVELVPGQANFGAQYLCQSYGQDIVRQLSQSHIYTESIDNFYSTIHDEYCWILLLVVLLATQD